MKARRTTDLIDYARITAYLYYAAGSRISHAWLVTDLSLTWQPEWNISATFNTRTRVNYCKMILYVPNVYCFAEVDCCYLGVS